MGSLICLQFCYLPCGVYFHLQFSHIRFVSANILFTFLFSQIFGFISLCHPSSPSLFITLLLFVFFVYPHWYVQILILGCLLSTYCFLFSTYCFLFSTYCFLIFGFISLCHPSSPPLSGYDAHPCRDRPKSTEAIYYTFVGTYIHVARHMMYDM